MGLLDTALSALLGKRVVALEAKFEHLSKQEGPRGPRGAMGLQGSTGPCGQVGPAGKDGRDGLDGLHGEQGPEGKQGPQGTAGRDGADGAPGLRGISGAAGARGPKGEQGPQGETGPAPDHKWAGTKLAFKKPDGKWGKAVDLKGEKGDEGRGGIISIGGGRASGIGNLLPGAPNVEPAGIAVLQGGQWVNLNWPSFIAAIAGAIDMGAEMSRRADFVGDALMYRGEAAPGSAESAPAWRIKQIQFITGPDGKMDIVEKWAGGTADFTQIWDDRSSLGYA